MYRFDSSCVSIYISHDHYQNSNSLCINHIFDLRYLISLGFSGIGICVMVVLFINRNSSELGLGDMEPINPLSLLFVSSCS